MESVGRKNTDMKKQKQLIYNLMTGLYDRRKVQFPECGMVEDEFAEGKPCEELYRRVYEANVRLCRRLGVREDKDVEIIINCMNDISYILAMKMFDYGATKEILNRD